MKNKENEFKVGDYIYYTTSRNRNNEFGVCKIEKIGRDKNLYGHWSDFLTKLPKTIEEFNKLIKHDSLGWMPQWDVKKLIFSNNTNNNTRKSIEHIINGNKTVVIIHNEDGTYSKGISRCNPEDEFDEYTGFLTAYMRALLGDDLAFEQADLSDYSNEDLLAELKERLK